ncbi:MAG: hypothetical protein KJ573_17020 [Proteobacteria bacterium]|nr:hypothetical protein [Desulfobacteraceae bacterium]MBU1905274.1 hypothetical protein [Pseudomonadota bacterium]
MILTTKTEIGWNNIRMVPILHNRMEFALEVRRVFKDFEPDHVAVEYPDTLKGKIIDGVKRLPLLSVVYYEEKDETFTYLLLEPTDGGVEAIRLALSNGIPLHFVDRDTEGCPPDFSPMPDPYAITRIGHFLYCQAHMKTYRGHDASPEDLLREKTMAYHLQELSKTGEKILFVGGLSHAQGILDMLDQPQTQVIGRRVRKGVGLAHLHRDSSREIMGEMPFLSTAYERSRTGPMELDRLKINNELIDIGRKRHWKTSKEEVPHSQIRMLNKFARNYAFLTENLVPSFYQIIVAARGTVDDNFAYEVWEEGSDYPYQSEEPGLPVLRLEGEDLFLDNRRIRFHRQLKTLRRRLVPVPVKKKKREQYPGEWQKDFKGFSICSYPPEDVVVEGYGHYLSEKALEIKTEENLRIEPFACSMLDGLDIRETIRKWTSRTIYVREDRPLKGKVGSVVVIFDPDLPDRDGREEFPWRVTWLGEHNQESDMAFYSTPAGEVMDGPGISRCQYGGFMMTYPPLRVYDVWRDPFFHFARNKPEKLLMAALDYSFEKHVVYVAATPPSGWCQSLAARLGKKIIYLPIGTFSPVTLKKIKQFHVLDGHPVRKYARDYI